MHPTDLLPRLRTLTSPFILLIIYIAYLVAIVVVHYGYYQCQCGSVDCWLIGKHADAPCKGTDWFGAAILDNYAFLAIIVYPLLIAYLQVTERLDADFRDMVVTLAGRGVLRALPAGSERPRGLRPERPEAVRELEGIRAWATRRGGLLATAVTLIVIFLVWNIVHDWFESLPTWYLITLAIFHIVLAIPLVFIAVCRMGRIFCYSLAVLRHRRYSVEPQPIVEHSDRAGGLKPLGDYFLAQTYRMSLISGSLILLTLFLLLSSGLEPRMLGVEDAKTHQDLFLTFSILTVFVLLVQLLSLFLPFSTVHARMIEFKRALIGRAGVMTRRRQRLLALLEAKQRAGQGIAAERAQLEIVERWIDNYEAFPAWPIPSQTLRNFWILWGGAIGTAISMLISAITRVEI